MENPIVKYEDNHLLILEKPSGWLVQGDDTGDYTLTNWGIDFLRKKYNKPGNVYCIPCHRLDRPVSGLVVFAKTSKALSRMAEIFRSRNITKTYLAIVQGTPEIAENTLVHWLDKDREKNRAKLYEAPKGNAKRASLSYSLVASLGSVSLLKINPKTGRPHQIRVQMKAINCPIKGDLKYGYTKPNKDKSIDLHAFQLSFIHPVKKEKLVVTSKPKWQQFSEFIHELD